jgi:hypothetical protein
MELESVSPCTCGSLRRWLRMEPITVDKKKVKSAFEVKDMKTNKEREKPAHGHT